MIYAITALAVLNVLLVFLVLVQWKTLRSLEDEIFEASDPLEPIEAYWEELPEIYADFWPGKGAADEH